MKNLSFIIYIIILFNCDLYAASEEDVHTNTCEEQDYIALRALYLSTDGDNWIDNSGWLTAAEFAANLTMPAGTDVSTWYGIATDTDGCVTCIDMDAAIVDCSFSFSFGTGSNNLSGNLPTEIGNLTRLKGIYLRNNQLTGNIPSTIGNLVNLENLDLSLNDLNGEIPSQIENLVNLEELDLRFNNLSGGIPSEIENLVNLEDLILSHNNLSGIIPPEIENLHNLIALWLDNNQLTGTIPSEIGNITMLNVLDLSNNQLTGVIPSEIGNINMAWTVRINLSNNQLSGNIPPEIATRGLWRLNLSNNELIGSIPPELGRSFFMEELVLNDNQLSGSIPIEIGDFFYIRLLKLNNNLLSGCYNGNLGNLCNKLFSNSSNLHISDGNNFDAPWEDFCATEAGVCPPCDPSACLDQVIVTVDYYNGESIYHEANNSIGATNTIDTGADVTYDAGNIVWLSPGFHAKPGSTFHAFIDGCCGDTSVEDRSDDSASEEVPEPENTQSLPTEFTLYNYPNPFTGQTTIEYNLPMESRVTLTVKDLTGKQIAVLVNYEQQDKDIHTVTFDGSNYPAGIYYYTIQAGNFVETQKMTLVR